MRSLLLINLLVAGALLAVPWVGTLIGDPARHARSSSTVGAAALSARSAFIGTLAIVTILFILTLIEAMGIMFFGRRRGWRITRNIAWQVCAHASIGWILAGALTLLALVLWLNVSYFGLTGWIERADPTADYLLALVPLVGFFSGMMVFEALVYLGVRRCRFANAPAP